MAKYFRGILGSQSPSSQPTGADTVARLVERVQSSTLLDDRRDAVRALKSLSKKFRLEVGTQGMDVLINVLQTDRGDGEIISYALDTLYNVVTTQPPEEDDEEFVSEAPKNLDPEDLSGQFTEIFIKSTENVSLLLGLLEEYDFHVRRPTVKLLTSLLMNRSNQLQQGILVSPMGVSKLVDLLSDSREVIRNDGLLLLIQLTKGNAAIQKIVAFENAFERLLEIITEEGNSDGGIVVEDCLLLLLNLIMKNSSNQTFFKEGSFIQRLTPFFDLQSASQPKSAEAGWSAQKVTNIHLMLQVIRTMVSPSNPQQATLACQKVMHQCGLLQQLSVILMASGVPADILTETINTVSEVIRGNNTNQDFFASVTAPSTPPRPAIVVLLMSMVNEKQPFVLRCAVLYCFQCFLFKNEVGQAQIVSTLLPSSAEVGAVTAGQLLCGGLFSLDSLSNWCAAVALAHALKDNISQKEQLLRVQLATSLGTPPVSLLQQCTNILAQPTSKLQSKVGLLILLCSWSSACPIAVTHFLNNPSNVPYLTSQVADNVDETDQVIQGLCAFMLGICVHFNDDSIAAFNKENLRQLIAKRIGIESFIEKLDAVSKHECYTKAAKKPQMRYDSSDQLLFDYEFTSLFKQLEGPIVKSVQGSGPTENSTENHQKTIEAHDNIVTQYKELIREQDKELQELKNEHKDLQAKFTASQTQIEEQLSQIQQLKDQYAVLKGQQDAMGQGEMAAQQAAIMDSFGISANTEEVSKLQQEIEDMKKLNDNLQQQLKEKDESIEKLKNDLTVSEAKAVIQEDSQQSSADNTSRITDLETENTKQNLELEELKTVILEQENEVKRYQSQVEELTNQIQAMGQGSSESATDNAALIAEKAAMATKISDLESQVSKANEETERLRKEMENVIKRKQELEDENKSLKEQNSSQSNDDELKNLTEQIKSLKEEKEKVEEEKNKLAEDMASTKKEQDDLLVLLADQDNKIDEYKKKLKELGQPVDDDDDDLDGDEDDDDEDVDDDDDDDDGEN